MQRTARGAACGGTGSFLKYQTLFVEFDSKQCEAELFFDADTQIAHPPSLCRGWGVSDMDGPASGSIPLDAQSFEAEEPTGLTLSERVQALFQQLHLPVFRYLLRKTRNAGTAEDLTQETFLRLCRHLRDQRPLDNAKAWLLTVANNLAIDEIRGGRHQTDLDETAWKEIEESRSATQADPEESVLQRERLNRLHAAVLTLTPLQRDCLHLRAEGLRYGEIAAVMKLSISTVVDAVRRATVKLAREFDSKVSL
jgi:RNA polymerase sigma-70 factor (ECF subfamily)